MSTIRDSFGTKISLDGQNGSLQMFSQWILEKQGLGNIDWLPFSIRVLREALLCNEDGVVFTQDDVAALAAWRATDVNHREVSFKPARIVLQDSPVVPAVAALHSPATRLAGAPAKAIAIQTTRACSW